MVQAKIILISVNPYDISSIKAFTLCSLCAYEHYHLLSITLVPRVSARWSRNLWVRVWLRLVFLIVSQIKLGSSESVSIFVQLLQFSVSRESRANQLASAMRNHFLCRCLYQRDRKTWFYTCVGGLETDGESKGGRQRETDCMRIYVLQLAAVVCCTCGLTQCFHPCSCPKNMKNFIHQLLTKGIISWEIKILCIQINEHDVL